MAETMQEFCERVYREVGVTPELCGVYRRFLEWERRAAEQRDSARGGEE